MTFARSVSVLGALVWLAPSVAHARDPWVNPGTMGANALPAEALEPPWTLPETQIWIGGAAQVGRRHDVSATPTYRLVAPIGSWVTTYVEGMAAEWWWASPQTLSEWALPRASGWAKADIRVGAKLLLYDATARGGPSVAVRVMTKTTAGKSYDERRFTNAPAYSTEALAGMRWRLPRGIRLDAFASVGFLSWQQGSNGQNDAWTVSAAIDARFFDRLTLRLEGRGYAGWERDDKVVVLAVRAMVDTTSWLSIAATASPGFISAPRFEGRLELVFRLPSVVPVIIAAARGTSEGSH